MRERDIEKALVKKVKQKGGLCLKLISPGTAGVPDRLVLMPQAKAAFVEVKRKGEKPRPLQLFIHKKLRALGYKVFVLDDTKDIESIIREVMRD